jgi:hypothetical protein
MADLWQMKRRICDVTLSFCHRWSHLVHASKNIAEPALKAGPQLAGAPASSSGVSRTYWNPRRSASSPLEIGPENEPGQQNKKGNECRQRYIHRE